MFSAATKSAAAASPTDPLFDYVTMMLPGNGTNGAQNNTFIDSSSNNFSITRSGNTTQGTFSPYGPNWSNYFDGTSYLTLASSAEFSNSNGITIEAWVYYTSISNYSFIVSSTTGTNNYNPYYFIGSTNTGRWSVSWGNATRVDTGISIALNTWNHIAMSVTFNGNGVLYLNGQSIATTSGISMNVASTGIAIADGGGQLAGSYLVTGYISNVRIVKNASVYTGAFTPSLAPLTAISGTSLLTCQSNRFIDNSNNNFAITRTQNPNIQRFSPFNPPASYNPSNIGGSGYFDGTTDFLTAVGSGAVVRSSGSFTIEGWYYPTSTSASFRAVYSSGTGYATAGRLYIGSTTSATEVRFYWGVSSFVTGTVSAVLNAWNHFAVTWDGTTTRIYINGQQSASTTSATYSGTVDLSVGESTYSPSGFISNFRVVGSVVYTAAFTPPTAPVTAIANTRLLLNMTNAGIIDNAMMNDWETIANAQITTTQSKFGGSSIYIPAAGDSINCPVFVPMLGSGNWTIEMWMRSSTTTGSLCGQPSGSGNPWCILFDTGALYFQNNTGLSNTLSNINVGNLLNAAWHHLAIVKNGTTVTCYVDGTSRGTGTDSTSYVSTSTMKIGGTTHPSYSGVTVYVNDFRITRGIARYTANFTPASTAFPTR